MIERAKPVAEQVYEVLKSRLEMGQYAPDERMPSETQFADEFEVSRATIRSALTKLEAHSLVTRRQGDGTYASPSAFDIFMRPHEEWQIVQQVRASGRKPSIEVLEAKLRQSTRQETSELSVDSASDVWHLRYRFRADDIPVMVASYVILASLLRAFDPAKDLTQPLTRFLSQFAKHFLSFGEAQFDGIAAPREVAADLKVELASPVLEIGSTIFGQDNLPLVLIREYYRQGEGLRIQVRD